MKRRHLHITDVPPYTLKYGALPKFNFKEWAARRAAAGKPLTAVQVAPKFHHDNPLHKLPPLDAAGA